MRVLYLSHGNIPSKWAHTFQVMKMAEALAAKLAGGHWTHDYALTAAEAAELGLPVRVGMPVAVMELMKLYPQPVQRSGVEYLPIDIPQRRVG